MINKSDLENYYGQQEDELRFKNSRANSLEYITTIKFLDKVCPENSKILDACAGTGIYSFYLSEKGHQVTAGDIVSSNVDIIKEKNKSMMPLDEIYCGDMRELSRFEDESFDVVLCLGAFYHLQKKEDREKAVSECARVAKKGGKIIIAYLNKFASFVNNFNNNSANMDILMHEFNTGNKSIFYRSSPREIEEVMKKFNVKRLHNIGTDGIGFLLSERLDNISNTDFDKYLIYHFETCENENVLGYSLHGLFIGEK